MTSIASFASTWSRMFMAMTCRDSLNAPNRRHSHLQASSVATPSAMKLNARRAASSSSPSNASVSRSIGFLLCMISALNFPQLQGGPVAATDAFFRASSAICATSAKSSCPASFSSTGLLASVARSLSHMQASRRAMTDASDWTNFSRSFSCFRRSFLSFAPRNAAMRVSCSTFFGCPYS